MIYNFLHINYQLKIYFAFLLNIIIEEQVNYVDDEMSYRFLQKYFRNRSITCYEKNMFLDVHITYKVDKNDFERMNVIW